MNNKTINGYIHYVRPEPIQQYTLQGILIAEYPSMWEAEKRTRINQSNISACCNGNRRQANGYIWKFKNKLKRPHTEPNKAIEEKVYNYILAEIGKITGLTKMQVAKNLRSGIMKLSKMPKCEILFNELTKENI